MNKLLKKFTYIVGMAAAIFAAGCSDDIDPEITSLNVNQLFSPVGLDARVVNKTSVRLNWNSVKNAKTYTIQFFENGNQDFSGTPVREITGVTYDVVPYTVTGFGGETSYSVRIKAVGEDITDSKWVSATFKTDAEQIFYNVNPEEITAFTVVLRWPAGEVATSITLNPGNVTHTVTSSEVAAGMAEITGLAGETNYTATLLNGTKVRGTVTFRTLVDIGDAIAVHPEDDLKAAIDAAQAGDVLVLFPGVYTVLQGDIEINKSITIKGLYPHNKPIIYNRFVFSAGVENVTFRDLEMVGTYGSDPVIKLAQAFFFNAGTYNVNSFLVEGCTIRGYNQALIYGGSAVMKIETLTFNNCVVSNIINDGGDFIDFRSGHVVKLTITNSTFNKVAAAPRDFIRLDNSSGSFPGSTSAVVIDRCTFYEVSNGRRILYVRFVNNTSTISNTIFAGAEATYGGYYSNQAATTQPVCSKNNYFNAASFLSGVTNGKFDISGTHTSYNPGFVNAASGNFTVTNEELQINGIGDPRWLQ